MGKKRTLCKEKSIIWLMGFITWSVDNSTTIYIPVMTSHRSVPHGPLDPTLARCLAVHLLVNVNDYVLFYSVLVFSSNRPVYLACHGCTLTRPCFTRYGWIPALGTKPIDVEFYSGVLCSNPGQMLIFSVVFPRKCRGSFSFTSPLHPSKSFSVRRSL